MHIDEYPIASTLNKINSMRKFLILMLTIVVGLCQTKVKAQESVVTSGGEANSSSGTISYTIGQLIHFHYTETSGYIGHGVQMPYEISVVSGIDESVDINLSFAVYPNPTNNILWIKKDGDKGRMLTYSIYDITGKLIGNGNLINNETSIHLGGMVSSTYLLKIYNNKKEVKVFRVVKN